MQEGDAKEEEEQEDTLPILEVSIRLQPQREEKEEDVGSENWEEFPSFRTLWRGRDTWGGTLATRSHTWGKVW